MTPCSSPWRLEDLYRQYAGMTFRLCLKYVQNRDEAHEMVQETFMNVSRGLPGFQGASSPKTWIYRIAVNRCLSRMEERKREREGVSRFFDERSAWQDAETGLGADDRMEVESLLKMTDPITRRVLYLTFGQGLTHAQVARVLGVSRVAVTRRVTRFKAMAADRLSFGEPESSETSLAA